MYALDSIGTVILKAEGLTATATVFIKSSYGFSRGRVRCANDDNVPVAVSDADALRLIRLISLIYGSNLLSTTSL